MLLNWLLTLELDVLFAVSEADQSNSSWAEMQPYVIGSYSMEPLTTTMKQRMILQYLIPMGEYQEVSRHWENRSSVSVTCSETFSWFFLNPTAGVGHVTSTYPDNIVRVNEESYNHLGEFFLACLF